MVISFFQVIIRPIFGTFEREELKKFLRLGVTFFLIIGSYWTMRGLKKAIFFKLADATQIPYAKIVSIFVLLPLVMLYSKLLDRFPREKMFYLLAITYGTLLAVFSLSFFYFQASPEIIAQRVGLAKVATIMLGYAWYVFVESFGSLVVALFWALSQSMTSPDSAKKGFSLVYALGNLGAVLMPLGIGMLPGIFQTTTDSLQVLTLVFFVLALIGTMQWFLRVTPKHLLTHGYEAVNEKTVEKKQEPGLFEGLKILVANNYLLGIFAAVSFFEIIVTVFDYNFDVVAQTTLGKTAALSAYHASYASYVGAVTLICLLLGVSNITRYLGVTVALALVPLILGGAMGGFLGYYGSLNFFFWLMVGSKALGYALQGPALKQLYIPISSDARFKSQAWIETFGSRGAKTGGEMLNIFLTPFRSGIVGFAVVAAWFPIALFLGKTYNKAIKENKLVC
jgi:ATP:ADP antiporter, AAA family